MKALFSKKWVKIGLISALALFVVLGMAIPLIRGVIRAQNMDITNASNELLNYPQIDKTSVQRFKGYMEAVTKSDWKKEKFEAQVLDGIEKIAPELHADEISGAVNFERVVYTITAQQILLESVDYESEAIKKAYDKKIAEILDLSHIRSTDSKHYCAALMEEPYETDRQEEKIYDVTLKYYTAPRTYFLETYLPNHFEKLKTEAFASKDTNALISILHKLSILSVYPEIDIAKFADTDAVIALLTTDAEKIIVKKDAGGYYDGAESNTSQDNKSDELFDYVAGAIAGTEVNSNSFKFKQVKYYGDLSSYYFESGLAYSYKDENGKQQTNSSTKNTRRVVFLKGKAIHEGDTVNENCLKPACEDGMTNYHKDGNCFGAGNGAFTCYVGNYTFILKTVK